LIPAPNGSADPTEVSVAKNSLQGSVALHRSDRTDEENDKMAHSQAEFIEVGRTTLSARVSPEEMNKIRQTKKS
jgi:hypothetical protein